MNYDAPRIGGVRADDDVDQRLQTATRQELIDMIRKLQKENSALRDAAADDAMQRQALVYKLQQHQQNSRSPSPAPTSPKEVQTDESSFDQPAGKLSRKRSSSRRRRASMTRQRVSTFAGSGQVLTSTPGGAEAQNSSVKTTVLGAANGTSRQSTDEESGQGSTETSPRQSPARFVLKLGGFSSQDVDVDSCNDSESYFESDYADTEADDTRMNSTTYSQPVSPTSREQSFLDDDEVIAHGKTAASVSQSARRGQHHRSASTPPSRGSTESFTGMMTPGGRVLRAPEPRRKSRLSTSSAASSMTMQGSSSSCIPPEVKARLERLKEGSSSTASFSSATSERSSHSNPERGHADARPTLPSRDTQRSLPSLEVQQGKRRQATQEKLVLNLDASEVVDVDVDDDIVEPKTATKQEDSGPPTRRATPEEDRERPRLTRKRRSGSLSKLGSGYELSGDLDLKVRQALHRKYNGADREIYVQAARTIQLFWRQYQLNKRFSRVKRRMMRKSQSGLEDGTPTRDTEAAERRRAQLRALAVMRRPAPPSPDRAPRNSVSDAFAGGDMGVSATSASAPATKPKPKPKPATKPKPGKSASVRTSDKYLFLGKDTDSGMVSEANSPDASSQPSPTSAAAPHIQIDAPPASTTEEDSKDADDEGFLGVGIHPWLPVTVSRSLNIEEITRLVRLGVYQFNKDYKKGTTWLMKRGVVFDSPKAMALFLRHERTLCRQRIGEFLGETTKSFNMDTLKAYAKLFKFHNIPFDIALRNFVSTFRIPGEAQKIEKILEVFAELYFKSNPDIFASGDTALVLAFAMMMLNTDAHNPANVRKMSKDQFVRNTRGIDDGEDLPREFLEAIYDNITTNEFKPESDNVSLLERIFCQISDEDMTSYICPWRQFVSQCNVTTVETLERPKSKQSCKQRMLFLFNDLLLAAKPIGKSKYHIKGIYPLYGTTLRFVHSQHFPNAFELINKLDGGATLLCFNIDNMNTSTMAKKFEGELREMIWQCEAIEGVRVQQLERRESQTPSVSSLVMRDRAGTISSRGSSDTRSDDSGFPNTTGTERRASRSMKALSSIFRRKKTVRASSAAQTPSVGSGVDDVEGDDELV